VLLLALGYALSAYAQDAAAIPAPATGDGPWATVVAVLLMALAQLGAVVQAHLKSRATERDKRIADLEALVETSKAEATEAYKAQLLAERDRDLARARLGDVSSDKWPEVGGE
jgi:hypothetical protein